MDLNSLLLFIVACLAINMIPGPDVIYIVSNTMKGKLVTGFKAAMGLGVGYFVHTLAASLGLSAIILSSAVAFSAVKWLGAAYLVYLGVQSLLSMWRGGSTLKVSESVESDKNVFVQGVIVSVLNPKLHCSSFRSCLSLLTHHQVRLRCNYCGLVCYLAYWLQCVISCMRQ